MYITDMERFQHILQKGRASAMTPEDVIGIYVDEWLTSNLSRDNMLAGERYYRTDNDINQRKRMVIGANGIPEVDPTLTNCRVPHGFIRKLVDQKCQYLFGKPFTIQTENKEYAGLLNDLFDAKLRRTVKNLCKDAVNKGIGWLQAYVDEQGKLCFRRIPPEQCIPLWTDSEHSKLDGMIRTYVVETYEARTKIDVQKVEYWDGQGVGYYTRCGGRLINDVEREPAAHLTIDGQPYCFSEVPFIPFKYNNDELPLIVQTKALVDDYDLLKSDDSNAILDTPNSILVVRNYGGTSLGEFRKNIAQYKAVKVSDNGGLEALNTEVHTDAIKTHLELDRKDIYEIGRGVDTQADRLGNASGVALKFLYADLDMDCNGIEMEFSAGFEQMRGFIDAWLALTGKGDFSSERAELVLNRDIIINETEAIQSCRDSEGVISDKTIRTNHPWVTDAEEEQKQLEKERAAEQREPYTGLNNAAVAKAVDREG